MQWYLNFLEKGGNGTPYYLWYRQHDFSKKLSTDAKFLTFEIEGKQGVIQEAVNGGKNTITIELPKGTPLANVTPKFTLSEGATLKAPTLPVTLTADTEYPFTLRAEDGKTERVYYLTVTLKDDMKTSGTELYTDTIKLQDENQRDLEILKKTVTETETGADILLNIRKRRITATAFSITTSSNHSSPVRSRQNWHWKLHRHLQRNTLRIMRSSLAFMWTKNISMRTWFSIL